MAYIYDLTDTWSAAGTVFNGIKLNVTNSASASGSKLMTLQIGGTEFFGVSKEGDVRIGNGGDLRLGSATGTTAPTGDSSIYNDANDMIFATGTTTAERMRLSSGGNLGIGTNSPAQKLSVNGNIVTAGEVALSGSDFVYSWAGGTTGQRRAGFYLDGTSQVVRVYTAQNEVARFDASGQVGIGTSSPATKLHILTASATAVALRAGNSVSYAEFQVDASGNSQLIAPSGVQIFNTNGAERARINSSGNLLLGTTASKNRLTVSAGSNTNSPTLGSAGGIAYFSNSDPSYGLNVGNSAADGHVWFQAQRTDGTATAYNITLNEAGGNVMVGTTTSFGKFSVFGTSGFNADSNAAISGSGAHKFRGAAGTTTISTYDYLNYTAMQFIRDNGNPTNTVGSITCTDGSTSYNTSSDRRLKKDVIPAPDAGAIVDSIEIISHGWKSNDTIVPFGVIAQDLNEVAPQAVHAGDDGEEIDSVWGVDYSKLVPMLIKEVQSLRARVAQLEGN